MRTLKKLWNRFLVFFINGIVIILPISITVALIRFFVDQLNRMVLEPILRSVEPVVTGPVPVYVTKAVIFLVVIFIVAFTGWAAKVLFIKRMFTAGENLVLRLPVLGRIYNAAKQLFGAFLGQGKGVFKQVVLIEYPRKGLYSIGFTTGETKGLLKCEIPEESVNVFLPTTPNPTSGIFLIVPISEMKVLAMTVEEGMKVVVSGGSVAPLLKER